VTAAPTGYLDTNFISALARDQHELDTQAMERLLGLRDSGAIDLYTSPRVREEIAKIPACYRAPHEELLRQFEALPESGEELVIGMLGTARALRPVPDIEDAELVALRSMLRGDYDPRHLFQAITNGVDYFVTADVGSIVKHAGDIEAKFPIPIRTPRQLITELDAAPP